MVTINDKISLIIDTDNLFKIDSNDVQAMINGDTYRINILYDEAINNIKRNINYKFTHIISNEIKSLKEWMNQYQCNLNDPMSIVIFLRIAEPILI